MMISRRTSNGAPEKREPENSVPFDPAQRRQIEASRGTAGAMPD
jgi:hypothetical protein